MTSKPPGLAPAQKQPRPGSTWDRLAIVAMIVLAAAGAMSGFLTWLEWGIGIDRPSAIEHLLKVIGSLVLAAGLPAVVLVVGRRRQDVGTFVVACVLLPSSVITLGADLPASISRAVAQHELENRPPTRTERSVSPAELRDASSTFWDGTIAAAGLTRVKPIYDPNPRPESEQCPLRSSLLGYLLHDPYSSTYWNQEDRAATYEKVAAYWRSLGYEPQVSADSVSLSAPHGPIRRAALRPGSFGLELTFEAICVVYPR